MFSYLKLRYLRALISIPPPPYSLQEEGGGGSQVAGLPLGRPLPDYLFPLVQPTNSAPFARQTATSVSLYPLLCALLQAFLPVIKSR